jgi:hypothetical protein
VHSKTFLTFVNPAPTYRPPSDVGVGELSAGLPRTSRSAQPCIERSGTWKMEVRANTKTELASLLSAAVHAQSAWVKLCETQTAKVKNKEGGRIFSPDLHTSRRVFAALFELHFVT